MSKTHKIKETRLWTCEYEIEINGFLSDWDIEEAIAMAWQTTEVKRWFVFKTEDNREGRVRKLSREIYDDNKHIERLNETQEELIGRVKKYNEELEEEWSDEETGIVLVDLSENA
jgi:hypothetical protein|tara:strand:+ start:193 stop:537 length:345 start_codon:yes stop_codon:yes gene_type:complete